MASDVETRKSIIKIFQEHPEWSFIKMAREAGVCRKMVSIVIRHFKDLTINHKEKSGKKKGFLSPKTAKKESIRESDRITIKSMTERIPEKIKNFCQK